MASKNKSNSSKKSLIFLKSSVIALGIVFLVLLALLVIMKVNKNKQESIVKMDCKTNSQITIKNEISKIIDSKRELIILTKPKGKIQQILTLDKRCNLLKSRVDLIIE